jgi:hypothetical protein
MYLDFLAPMSPRAESKGGTGQNKNRTGKSVFRDGAKKNRLLKQIAEHQRKTKNQTIKPIFRFRLSKKEI